MFRPSLPVRGLRLSPPALPGVFPDFHMPFLGSFHSGIYLSSGQLALPVASEKCCLHGSLGTQQMWHLGPASGEEPLRHLEVPVAKPQPNELNHPLWGREHLGSSPGDARCSQGGAATSMRSRPFIVAFGLIHLPASISCSQTLSLQATLRVELWC